MDQITIGPLTGDEWASLALGDDERNPLPPCCANLSEVRDTLFAVMRAGGDVEVCWPMMVEVWPAVEEHLGEDAARTDPVLSKLYKTYVEGRTAPEHRAGGYDVAMAQMMAKDPAQVDRYIDMIEAPESGWDIDTRRGQLDAIAVVGGRQVALVFDPDERFRCTKHLAEVLGGTATELSVIIDVLRAFTGLPYDPANPADRDA